ncbi:MAG: carbon-nitrogen hydrolase family protein [Desulfobacterales bacterium]|nr:carbon-nitrogen hydrolase family protein [Desulfobacterales bacterium]
MTEKVTISAAMIQESPVFLNLKASMEKTEDLIEKAAGAGAGLVVFPETWLPGYPVWLDNAKGAAMWNQPGAKSLYRILCENAVTEVELKKLSQMAGKNKVDLVMGCHEIDGNTLYNTMVFCPSTGGKAVVHRKLMPTYNEKLIWGWGDGSTLSTMDTAVGCVGGLICWEHWMPLARAAMHAKKEVIHAAQWPSVIDLHQIASRHYAFEGRCFVLACGTVMTKAEALSGFDSLDIDAPEARDMLASIQGGGDTLLMTGGSAAIGPDAGYVTEPVYEKRDIFMADLDLKGITESAMVLDTDGHYARPDIFSLTVNEAPMGSVVFQK